MPRLLPPSPSSVPLQGAVQIEQPDGRKLAAQYSVQGDFLTLKTDFGSFQTRVGIFRPDFVARALLKEKLRKNMPKDRG